MDSKNAQQTGSQPLVATELVDQVLVISLDDGKVNAFSSAMIDAVNQGLDEAEKNAKAVIIRGKPGLFSAGYDLKVIKAGEEARKALMKKGTAMCARLFSWPQPVVFAMTGHAMALGGILLLGGDYRIGLSGDYKIGLTEVAIGMPMPFDGIAAAKFRMSDRWIHRAVGQSETLNVEQGLEAGFLDQVVETEQELDKTAMNVAIRLAELPSEAFWETKKRLRAECIKSLEALL